MHMLKDLRFGITVTELVSTGEGELNRIGESGAVSSPEVILAQDLKGMFANPDNYSDLKLETKDGVETNTHKFILAARSPVLQAIIEKEYAKESFKGVIKIPDFNAKPIIAVLHWMYTGRLSDRTGNVIEEVVIAAKKYQLTDMMRQLDKEMITICNTGNMFQLFEAARQNQLPIAMVQISAFIKENIETMVPHA
ncbi:Speckle-type POZ protein-like [Orchesella cincta]|uniref:Speckle-type POZ protein-like n=1 Tax=Orchesella cincta TaxID=48709 RepID=A0A1D2M802_ORCCI|nr:Speckle-type POZ protein-like [Orchesella cincta]